MTKSKHSLKIIGSNGVQSTVPLYTSLSDMKSNPDGEKGHQIKIDGETFYFPIGSTSDPEATPGRLLLHKDGKTYAILKTGTPSYTQGLVTVPSGQASNSNFSQTFTVPAGVTRVRIAMCSPGYKTKIESRDDRENEHYVQSYDINKETTTIKSSDNKININVKTVQGSKQFQYGCKASFKLEERSSGASRNGFYGCPWVDFIKKHPSGQKLTPPNNYYYSGYINVTPGQKITCTVGGKCGYNDSSFCGFILYAYGVGIEK